MLLGALLTTALVFMVEAATRGGDWPGWDEGWVLIAFPLGIPAAVATGLRRVNRQVALITGSVWCWGALLFLLWIARG